MGATGWSYFVPYQPDINKALKELGDQVFREGQYQGPFEFDEDEFESQRAYLASIYQTLPEGLRERAEEFLDPGGCCRKATKAQASAQNDQTATRAMRDRRHTFDSRHWTGFFYADIWRGCPTISPATGGHFRNGTTYTGYGRKVVSSN